MLNTYLQNTQLLVNDLKQEIITPALLTTFINTARGQVAAEGKCVRSIGTIVTVVGQRAYAFSNIGFNTNSIQGALNVRRIQYSVATGQKWVKGKSWEWFDFQRFNNPVPDNGPPNEWAQYAQGVSGSFYLDPLPDMVYMLNCDCECYPLSLVGDLTPEALPYLWTDAVPFFAAYLAYLFVQKQDTAQTMLQMYENFMQRARNAANPDVTPFNYEQSADFARQNRLGVASARAQ